MYIRAYFKLKKKLKLDCFINKNDRLTYVHNISIVLNLDIVNYDGIN